MGILDQQPASAVAQPLLGQTGASALDRANALGGFLPGAPQQINSATGRPVSNAFGNIPSGDYYTDDPAYRYTPLHQRPTRNQLRAQRDFRFSDAGRRQNIIDNSNWMVRPGLQDAEWNRIGTQEMFDQNIALQELGLGLKERLYAPYMGSAGDLLEAQAGYFDRLDLGDIFSNFPDFGFGRTANT